MTVKLERVRDRVVVVGRLSGSPWLIGKALQPATAKVVAWYAGDRLAATVSLPPRRYWHCRVQGVAKFSLFMSGGALHLVIIIIWYAGVIMEILFRLKGWVIARDYASHTS